MRSAFGSAAAEEGAYPPHGRGVLGFHYHQPARQDAEQISMTYFLGSFIDSIAPYFIEVVLFLHGPSVCEDRELTYRLHSSNVRLISLGRRRPVYIRILLAPWYQYVFRRHGSEVDVMLFRVSTVLLPFVARYFCDRVLYFVSHSSKGIEKLNQPWYRLALIRLWTSFYAKRESSIARESRCVTNSFQLQTELEVAVGQIMPVIPSTTLLERDLRSRRASFRPLNRPARLLFVGRFSFLKGVLDILRALRSLRLAGHDVGLSLVGEFAGERDFRAEALSFIERSGLSDHVRFLGFVGGGDELWKIYQEADVLIMASRESEGFPRVIWEAMANGLPVVSTRVGSIPLAVGEAVELVEPRQPEHLAAGIARVLRSESHRRTLVECGLALVSGNTLENRGEQLARFIWRARP